MLTCFVKKLMYELVRHANKRVGIELTELTWVDPIKAVFADAVDEADTFS